MLKLAAAVALFAGFCWFGTQIPLGSHTLFGHLHAIAGTKESQDLFDGTKESAKPLVDDVRRRIAGAPDPTEKLAEKPAGKPAGKPADRSDRAEKSQGKSEGKSDDKSEDQTHRADSHQADPHQADPHNADPHQANSDVKVAGTPQRGTQGHKDEITSSERRRLRRLISSAEASAPR